MFFKKKESTLITYTLKIDGMRCGMCETHVNDYIRRNFDVKKVRSSASKGTTIIQSEKELDVEKITKILSEGGYIVVSWNKE